MKEEEAKEGLRVVDSEGFGTLHENIGHKDVSEWFRMFGRHTTVKCVAF
jgi:hypothetical protein